ncbi:MAG: nucleotidyl transferase AbiEii/AbiGii toxin family protein [Anaerolineales bacterium]
MTAIPEGLDLQRITDALARHNVRYLLVGGIASRAHGAQRPTYDFDCVPEASWENLDRLAAAMRDLRARLRVEGLSDEEAAVLPVQVTGSTLVRMEISTWRTDAGDLDVLTDIPDRDGRHMRYAELICRASELHVDGIVVRVAALDDVIASKEWANRPKDRDALPELRSLRGE